MPLLNGGIRGFVDVFARRRGLAFVRHQTETGLLLLKSMRPSQWIKNGFVLIPLVFSEKLFCYEAIFRALEAGIVFCILTGGIYLANDIIDVEADRMHPTKKMRPLASGKLSVGLAKVASGILLLCSFASGGLLGWRILVVLAIYLTLQVLYNYWLKATFLLDVFCISAGFFLRVLAGAVAIQVEMSHWLVICATLISLFLALAKRRGELTLLKGEEASNHRKVLLEYNPQLLDQMIAVVTASTVLSYMLYCFSPETIEYFGTDRLIFTFPFVLYGVFRYLYLIYMRGDGDSPERLVLSDMPLLVNNILWVIVCILVIYL